MKDLGIGLGKKETPKFLRDLFDVVQGMMYLDLSDHFQLSSCREYMFAMIDTVHIGMPDNPTFADKFVGQWFNPNSGHFLGKNSNYWTDIIDGNPIFTNNGSKSMNSALNHLFPSG